MSVDELIQTPGQEYELIRKSVLQDLHCASPGIVASYDPAVQTVSVQLALRGMAGGEYVDPPVLMDVPVFFPGGAASGMTFPIVPGDECLVVFADGCVDGWFQSGGVSNPALPRRHDYSDAFAFVGFRSRKNALKNVPAQPSFFGDTKSALIDLVYPVGSVYQNVEDVSPSELFGGVWKKTGDHAWARLE